MTKKSTTKKLPRGRGGKQGSVRIKIARVVSGKGASLRSQGSNSDVYEDVMLYVKDGPVTTPRKRGRPKKLLPQIAHPVRNPPEVIYVPSMRRDNPFVPYVTQAHKNQELAVVARSHACQPVKSVIQRPTVQIMKTHCPVEAVRPNKDLSMVNKVDWPADLRMLACEWDRLPENDIRELLKWLNTPVMSTNYPQIVNRIHTTINDWDEDNGVKMELIGLWLMEQYQPAATTLTQPKVVVEVQPTPVNICGQWSSITENRNNREP